MAVLSRKRPLPLARSAADRAVLDDYLDCYIDWREESASVQSAYEDWRDAHWHDRRDAFIAYAAAIEREDQASRTYSELARQVTDLTRRGRRERASRSDRDALAARRGSSE